MKIIFENTDSKFYNNHKKNVADKLQELYIKHPNILKAYVLFKMENDYRGSRKICEINIFTSGPEFLVISNEDSFDKAIKSCSVVLEHQMMSSIYHAAVA